jgi:anti-anti-sigma factor
VLLPAGMKLLGDWNWYLPSWLEWLPRVAPEVGTPSPAAVAAGDSRLSVDVDTSDEEVALKFRGELDLGTASKFHDDLADAERQGTTVVVDLRGVTFIDSSGVGELLGAHQRARREHRRLVIVRGDDTPVAQVLHISALDQRIEVTGADDSPAGSGQGR